MFKTISSSKTIATILAIVLCVFSAQSVRAQSDDLEKGACVMGSVKFKGHKREFIRPVKVFADAKSAHPTATMKVHDVYYVDSDIINGRVKLIFAPGMDENPNAGKTYGWVQVQDLTEYDNVNCF